MKKSVFYLIIAAIVVYSLYFIFMQFSLYANSKVSSIQDFSVSADGSIFAFSKYNGNTTQLFYFKGESKNITKIYDFPADNVIGQTSLNILLSEDNENLIFLKTDYPPLKIDGESFIPNANWTFFNFLTGETKTIDFEKESIWYRPLYFNDGELYYSYCESGQNQNTSSCDIFVSNYDGQNSKRLTNLNASRIFLSNNAKFVIFSNKSIDEEYYYPFFPGNEIFIYDLEKNSTNLINLEYQIYDNPVISSDGKTLIFSTNSLVAKNFVVETFSLDIASLEKKKIESVSHNVDEKGVQLINNDRIAFMGGDDKEYGVFESIWTVNLDGSDLRQIYPF